MSAGLRAMEIKVVGRIGLEYQRALYQQFEALASKPLYMVFYLQYAPRALMDAILSFDPSGARVCRCYANGFLTLLQCENPSSHAAAARAEACRETFPVVPFAALPTGSPFPPCQKSRIQARAACRPVDYGFTNEELRNFRAQGGRREGGNYRADPARDCLRYARFYGGKTWNSSQVSRRVLGKYQISSNSNVFQVPYHGISSLQIKRLGLHFREEDAPSEMALFVQKKVHETCGKPSSYHGTAQPADYAATGKPEAAPLSQNADIYILSGIPPLYRFLDAPGTFMDTYMTYLELVTYLLGQMRASFLALFRAKETQYLDIDDQFQLSRKYELTTKQIKRARIGHSLSILLELCQLLKAMHNVLVCTRIRYMPAQNAGNMLLALLQDTGRTMAIYRFKYKTVRQFRALQAMRELNIRDASLYFAALRQTFRALRHVLAQYIQRHILRMLGERESAQVKTISRQRRAASIERLYLQASGELRAYFLQAWRYWRADFSEFYSTHLTDAYNSRINALVADRWRNYRVQCLQMRYKIYFEDKIYKYSEIRDNFNKFTVLLAYSLLKHDLQLLNELKNERTQSWYRALFKKASTATLPFVQTHELSGQRYYDLALDAVSRFSAAVEYSSADSELLKLSQTNYPLFFEKMLAALAGYYSSYVELRFYDYLYHVDTSFSGKLLYDVLDQLVIALVFDRVPQLAHSAISLSDDSCKCYFERSDQQLDDFFGDQRHAALQVSFADFGLVFDVSIRFLERIFALFLDVHITNYIVKRLYSVFLVAQRQIKPSMFVFTTFPLSVIPIQLIKLLQHYDSISSQERQYGYSYEFIVQQRSLIKCCQGLRHVFVDFRSFLMGEDATIGYFASGKSCIEDSGEDALNELDFTTPHLFERRLTRHFVQDSSDQLLIYLWNSASKQRSVVSISLSCLKMLGFQKKTLSERAKPSELAFRMLRSQFLSMSLHFYAYFMQMADKFNKISLCFLSYFKMISESDISVFIRAYKALITSIQRRIRSTDYRRYQPEIFLLSRQNGGLGVFNFIPGSPVFSEYILDAENPDYGRNPQKIVQQYQLCYLPLLDNLLKHSTSAVINVYFDDVFKALACTEFVLENSLFQCAQQDYQNSPSVPKNFAALQNSGDTQIYFGKQSKAQQRGYTMIANRRFISFWSPSINRTNVFMGKHQRILQTGIIVRGKLVSVCYFYQYLFKGNLWAKIHHNIVQFLSKMLKALPGIESVRILAPHPEKIYGARDAPCSQDGLCADVLCTTLNQGPHGNNFTADVQLLFCNADQYYEVVFTNYIKSLVRQQRCAQISVFVDLAYCRVRVLADTSLDQIAELTGRKLSESINHFPAIRLLRRRAFYLLLIAQNTPESEIFVAQGDLNMMIQPGKFYVASARFRNGFALLAIHFQNGAISIAYAASEDDAIVKMLQSIDPVPCESKCIITEDTTLKRKILDSSALLCESEFQCAQSLLRIELSAVFDLATTSLNPVDSEVLHTRVYHADTKHYGSANTYFWRALSIFAYIRLNKQYAIRALASCEDLLRIPLFSKIPQMKARLELKDVDQRIRSYLYQHFRCSRQELGTLLVGGQLEEKRESVFNKNGNIIIAKATHVRDGPEEHYCLERVHSLQVDVPEKGLIYALPATIKDYVDLQRGNFSLCGRVIDDVREIRFLIKDFKGGFDLQEFGRFGTELRIEQDGTVHHRGRIVLTQRFSLLVLVQRGLQLLVWDFDSGCHYLY